MDAFFFYRKSHDSEAVIFAGKFSDASNLCPRGLLVSDFRNESLMQFTIEEVQTLDWNDINEFVQQLTSHSGESDDRKIKLPDYTTPAEIFASGVNSIVTHLRGNTSHKIVLSRIIFLDKRIDLAKTLSTLCEIYPGATVCAFTDKEYNIWISASPELLLEYHNTSPTDIELRTMSLAGTRSTLDHEQPWDVKNIYEQEIVTEFILNTLSKYGIEANRSRTYTRKAGPVEHICTEITYGGPKPRFEAIDILAALSPTPALCGYPREDAFDKLSELELHERYYYGGYFARIADNTIEAWVNVRSLVYNPTGIRLYSGCGITCHSDAEDEYLETACKATTLLNNICCI